MAMIALVIGATGATGKDLVQLLLADPIVSEVRVFVRRKFDFESPKLISHIVDFNQIDSWKYLLKGDVLFSMMGTTRSQAGSKEKQWFIDYDYQYNVARAAAENGVNTLELMSAVGANPNSSFFYTRMKGELETAVSKLPFKRVIITRPPSLIRKNTDRTSEKVSLVLLKFFNGLGILKNMTPIPTEQVALAMLSTAKDITDGVRILEPEQIKSFSAQ